MTVTDGVVIERKQDVIDITLNSPHNGNLVTNAIGSRIIDALSHIGADIKLIRLMANGPHFCRGRESPPIDRSTASAGEFREKIADPALALYQAFIMADVPVLGRVSGEALGVGCTLAALCDVSLASDDAVFQVPEMNHGIPPTLVMSALAGRIPTPVINWLVLSREKVPASQAPGLGLVSRVVPRDRLDAEFEALTQSVLTCRGPSLRAVKEYMRVAPGMNFEARRSLAATLISGVLSTR